MTNNEHVHNTLCELLAKEIKKRWGYNRVTTNVEYYKSRNNVMGETDVHVIKDKREVYYEIKCRYTDKNYEKAIAQTIRWSKHMKKKYPNKNFYGVYHSPTKTSLLCKNGYKRK